MKKLPFVFGAGIIGVWYMACSNSDATPPLPSRDASTTGDSTTSTDDGAVFDDAAAPNKFPTTPFVYMHVSLRANSIIQMSALGPDSSLVGMKCTTSIVRDCLMRTCPVPFGDAASPVPPYMIGRPFITNLRTNASLDLSDDAGAPGPTLDHYEYGEASFQYLPGDPIRIEWRANTVLPAVNWTTTVPNVYIAALGSLSRTAGPELVWVSGPGELQVRLGHYGPGGAIPSNPNSRAYGTTDCRFDRRLGKGELPPESVSALKACDRDDAGVNPWIHAALVGGAQSQVFPGNPVGVVVVLTNDGAATAACTQ